MPVAHVVNSRGRVEDPDVTPEDRSWGTVMHLTTVGGVLPVFPVLIVGPLVLWLWKRRESAFLDDHGREVLNFQISLALYALAAAVLTPVLIGFLLLPAVFVLGLVGLIAGTVAANRGEYYRYPMTLRLVH